MDLNLQRRVDRVIGTFICRIFSLFPKKNTSTKVKPKKILIILLSEMGSLVLACPMIDHIKKKYPEASVYFLLFEQNKEILELLDVVPLSNILTVSNTSLLKMMKHTVRALIKLRLAKIDTVIDCELFARISSIYSFLSGAKIRVGFHPHCQEGLFRGDFINRPVPYNPYNHISQQFITLAQAIESDLMPVVKREIPGEHIQALPLKFDEEEIRNYSEKFYTDFPHITGKKLVLLYTGGGILPIRAWPLEYFRCLTEALVKNGYAVGIIGMERDKDSAGKITANCRNDNCIDLTGYTESVRQVMLMFHFASLLITNDGGPGHFAAMTPVSAIVLYGPETPSLYGALSRNSYNFYVPLSCSPCLTAYNHRKSPCDGNNLCLKLIQPEEVLAKAYEILKSL
ncbi:MAG: glycosyltransferase family 9 protein [Desulfobacteraceae bacterium]|nr:glycosyltransferase family 9 protein [Desulfobacteraceae bacterium]